MNNALRYHCGAGIFRSRRKRSFFSEQSRISRHLVGARGRFSRHPVSRQRISLIGACITISILPSAPFTFSHSSTPIPAPTRQLFPQGKQADRLKNVARRLIGREKLRHGSVFKRATFSSGTRHGTLPQTVREIFY